MRGLYAIIDPDLSGAHEPLELALAVLRGGCAALQLRSKTLSDQDYLALAGRFQEACEAARVPFFVNDRLEAAVALGAPGLHLGQDDVPIRAARARYRGLIGLSTHDLSQVRRAHGLGADLIGFGPVFPTRSKVRSEPLVGVAGLRAACAESRVPVVAIGGIDGTSLGDVVDAGADMVAMIGALANGHDPEVIACRLHQAIAP